MKRIIHTDRLVLRPAYIGDAGAGRTDYGVRHFKMADPCA